MYQALYRKYRPKNFDEVVGQEHITSVLKQEIASGRIGRAYLFTGSRGTGKTSCSKIIAKAVSCPHQQDGNPCGVCDICRGIDDGSILDVTEIDAASNNGVDNIRQLREEANFTPAVTNYRVYIIDETHMLSTGAFNALLKIMRRSRPSTSSSSWRPPGSQDSPPPSSPAASLTSSASSPRVIAQRVIEVCQRENIDIQLPAAELIGRLAEGGMRDALSLLDVCRSSSEQITVEQVRQSAGLAVSDSLFAIGDAVLAQDIPAVLQEIDRMFANSVDFEKMCVQLISHYRGLMMAKALKDPENFVPGLSQDKEALTKQASRYSMGQILYSLTVLQDTLSRMGKTTQTRTELEMAVIRLTNPASDRSLDGILARLDRLEMQLKSGLAAAAAASANPAAVSAPAASNQQAVLAQPTVSANSAAPVDPPVPTVSKKEAVPFEPWSQVLEALRHSNTALHGALVNTQAYRYQEIVLIDCDDPFFLEMIRSNDYAKKSIHQALIAGSGRDWRIGPFKKEQYHTAQDDPMEDILASAQQLGVDISIEN